jgi:hypothetical protein
MRAALYARVSTEEQVEGYSLDAQRRAFHALVQGRGWTVYREYLEEGKSAHNDDINKRPRFKEAMDDALDGRYDVLVVHKIDRLLGAKSTRASEADDRLIDGFQHLTFPANVPIVNCQGVRLVFDDQSRVRGQVALEVIHPLADSSRVRGSLAPRLEPVVPEDVPYRDVRETFLYIVTAAA